jgi:hypothetical protein
MLSFYKLSSSTSKILFYTPRNLLPKIDFRFWVNDDGKNEVLVCDTNVVNQPSIGFEMVLWKGCEMTAEKELTR